MSTEKALKIVLYLIERTPTEPCKYTEKEVSQALYRVRKHLKHELK